MRQKILLLAALLHDPELLILDEPFSGLDVNAAMILRSLLRSLAEREEDDSLQLARAGSGGEGLPRGADSAPRARWWRMTRWRACAS